MPRADFYLIDKPRFREQPLLLVCELAKRGYAANLSILVLARDTAQAEAIDDLMWSFDPDEYLPHQIAGMDEGDDDTPILIATPDMDIPARPMLLNLRDAAPTEDTQDGGDGELDEAAAGVGTGASGAAGPSDPPRTPGVAS